jgi:predicted AlkP superfamily phosphohydrolase/phosphomutase
VKENTHSLFDSLKLSLTFWIIVAGVVWLNVTTANRLYTFDADVIKILLATLVCYAVLGLILWLPVLVCGKILSAIRFFGKNEFRLQLASHWFVGMMLTYFYQLHRVWMPYTWSLSLQGILATLALVAAGAITAWILVKIAGLFGQIPVFRSYGGVLASIFFLFILLYAGTSIMSGVARNAAAKVPDDLNQAYNTGEKVLLLGFDGATWSAIDPLMEQGLMPNFKAFLDEGIGAPLQTSQPTLSAILWTTIATGKTSEGHGVTEIVSTITPGLNNNVLNYPHTFGCYLFTQLLMKKGFFYVTPLSSSARQTKAVWNITTDYDKRAGVVGWWGTHPPEEVNGVIVSDHASMTKKAMRQAKGQLSDDEDLPQDLTGLPVYPGELMSEIAPFGDETEVMTLEELNYFLEADSGYLDFVNGLSGWDRSNRESVIKIAYLTDKFFRLTTEHLLDTQTFDMLAAYFFEADGIGHWMWPFREAHYFKDITPAAAEKYKDVIDSTYTNLDRMLGSLLSHVPEDYHVIIISDHGFGVEDYGGWQAVGHNLAPDGILMMKGPHFMSGAELQPKAAIQDITPTMLALLGIPVGDDMAGRVLEEAFEPDFFNQYPIRSIASHDRGELFRARATFSGEDDLLKEKLRALGYIE